MTTRLDIKSDATEHTAVQSTEDDAQEESLYFFPEAAPFRTPFRDSVCREIFSKARELAGDEFDGGNVTPQQFPGDDVPYLLVTVFIKVGFDDAGFDRIFSIDTSLMKHMSEVSESWSPAEKVEYQDRVQFDVFPAGS